MKKTVILLFLVCLSLSGCRTLKNNETSYNEVENTIQETESDKHEEEFLTKNTTEETEKSTREETEKTEALIEHTTDFYEPTLESPKGGAPKSTTTKIYVTNEKALKEAQEKAIKETEEKYEKLLSEKNKIIESKDKEIELLESSISEKDSRLIQKTEWFWVSLAFSTVLILAFIIMCSYKKLKSGGLFKKLFSNS
ncbi:hypothetical protein [Bacteroides sp. 224]|uniref:hypothetical protein n=1 Tax=Bacteroides sp. 224 TaxID=2302936 RepID=UPI0013D0EFF8|nr:hypothetical protein [Bacteroides sp. 224]NDV63907.1 hypothetical protein [Bacteroides sp. 224]